MLATEVKNLKATTNYIISVKTRCIILIKYVIIGINEVLYESRESRTTY